MTANQSAKLVVGLGNPGDEYRLSRHNVGFLFLDNLASKLNLEFKLNKKLNSLMAKDRQMILIKPQTFMNLSGLAVSAVIDYFQLTEIVTNPQDKQPFLLVHDDLDLRLGQYRFSFAKGPKGHNGLISVEQQLKTDRFWRLRIGIDNREPTKQSGKDYVLSKFSRQELSIITSLIDRLATKLISQWKLKTS